MTTQGQGRNRIDGVQVGELTVQVDPSTTSAMLTSKYALVDSTSGVRFGAGHKNVDWSEQTKAALVALLNSMERDICADVFEDGSTSSSGDGIVEPPSDGIPGF